MTRKHRRQGWHAQTEPAVTAGSPVLDLTQTLQLVADTIVESLGFEVAVVNIVDSAEDRWWWPRSPGRTRSASSC